MLNRTNCVATAHFAVFARVLALVLMTNSAVRTIVVDGATVWIVTALCVWIA